MQEKVSQARIPDARMAGRQALMMVKVVEGVHHPDAHVDVAVVEVTWGGMPDIAKELILPGKV